MTDPVPTNFVPVSVPARSPSDSDISAANPVGKTSLAEQLSPEQAIKGLKDASDIAQLPSVAAEAGVVDENGAPAIQAPTPTDASIDRILALESGGEREIVTNLMRFLADANAMGPVSSEIMRAELQEYAVKIAGDQAKVIKTEIDATNKNLELNRDEKIKKLEESKEKQIKADEMSLIMKIFGWLMTIIAAIVAVVTVVASIVTGPGVLGVLAAMIAVVAAVSMLTCNIIKEVDPTREVSLANVIQKLIKESLEAQGLSPKEVHAYLATSEAFMLIGAFVDPGFVGNLFKDAVLSAGAAESAGDITKTVGDLVAQLMIMIVVIVLTAGAGAAKGINDSVTKGLNTGVSRLINVLKAAGTITQGVTMIGSGAVRIQRAGEVRVIQENDAYIEMVDQINAEFSHFVDKLTEQMREVLTKGDQTFKQVLDMLKNAQRHASSIASSVGGRNV